MAEKEKAGGVTEPGAGKVGEKKVKKETVTVEKAKLESLLKEFGEMKTRLVRVESVADVGRLAALDGKTEKKGPTLYRISTYTNPKTKKSEIIMGWRTMQNVSFRETGSGMIREHQEYELTLEDETLVNVIGYKDFSDIRYSGQLVATLVSRKVDEHGAILELKLKDGGRVVKIDENFVN